MRSKVSPSGRYVFLSSGLYDIATNQFLLEGGYRNGDNYSLFGNLNDPGRGENIIRWMNDSTYLSVITGTTNQMRLTHIHNPQLHKVIDLDLSEMKQINGLGEPYIAGRNINNNVRGIFKQDASKYSLIDRKIRLENFDHKKIVLLADAAYILDLSKQNVTLFEEAAIELAYNKFFPDFIARVWTSSTQLLYATSSNIMNQGIWLYDTETKQKTKIHPYPATSFWAFPENVPYVFFRVGDKLYQCNKKGENVKLIKENLGRYTSISLANSVSYFDAVK